MSCLLLFKVPEMLFYTDFVSSRIFSNFPATLAGKDRNNLATMIKICVDVETFQRIFTCCVFSLCLFLCWRKIYGLKILVWCIQRNTWSTQCMCNVDNVLCITQYRYRYLQYVRCAFGDHNIPRTGFKRKKPLLVVWRVVYSLHCNLVRIVSQSLFDVLQKIIRYGSRFGFYIMLYRMYR
jgi:hypothetical protein